jgi:neutral trehalase
MWFCFNDGFVSAVVDNSDSTGNTLKVRARFRRDLEDIFPDKKIVENAGTDYAYRVFVTKDELAEIVKDRILNDLNYGNFKNSVVRDDLHDLYEDFWWVGYKAQNN